MHCESRQLGVRTAIDVKCMGNESLLNVGQKQVLSYIIIYV